MVRILTWCQLGQDNHVEVQSPNALSLERNMAENWTKFNKEFQFYMIATESINKPEDLKLQGYSQA